THLTNRRPVAAPVKAPADQSATFNQPVLHRLGEGGQPSTSNSATNRFNDSTVQPFNASDPELLEAIRLIFESTAATRIFSQQLLHALLALPEAPWQSKIKNQKL